MLRCVCVLCLVVLVGVSLPDYAQAGMPALVLSDLAAVRFDAISFFLLGLALSSLGIQLLWNHLRRDFTFLPRLTYFKACGVVTLWGLLFVIVLTMISGARELMTPGAWKKQGWTYQLVGEQDATVSSAKLVWSVEGRHDVIQPLARP